MKETSHHPSPTRKNGGRQLSMTRLLMGCMEISYNPKIGCHYFWPGLIALPIHLSYFTECTHNLFFLQGVILILAQQQKICNIRHAPIVHHAGWMECGPETGKFLFLANHSGELCTNHPHVSTIIVQIYLLPGTYICRVWI
jgi:hypothetical protein